MLYLLRSYLRDKSMLKAGYASDYNVRLRQYKFLNPGIEEVSKKDGEFIDETKIHLLLHFYGYGCYLDEWYEDRKEVVDVFNLPSEEIDKILWENRNKIFLDSDIRPEVLESIHDFSIINEEDVHDKTIVRYFKNKEAISLSKINNPDEDLVDILGIFKGTRNFEIRLKALCELFNRNIDAYNKFSAIISPVYKLYINQLGIEKCKANGYRESDLRSLLNNRRMSSEAKDLILSEFKVGEKYTKSKIKELLGEIYTGLGISKSPKAVDLEEYFEIKVCKIPNKITGKRDMGFEIIKKKG